MDLQITFLLLLPQNLDRYSQQHRFHCGELSVNLKEMFCILFTNWKVDKTIHVYFNNTLIVKVNV